MKFKSQLFVFALALAASEFVAAQGTDFTLTLSGFTGTDGYSTLPDAGATAITSDTPFDIQFTFNTSSLNAVLPGALGPGSASYTPLSEDVTVGGNTYAATVESGDLIGLADPSWLFIFGFTDHDVAGFVQGDGNNGFLPFYTGTASTTPGWNVANLTGTTFPAADQLGELQATSTLSFTIAGDLNPLNIDYDSSDGLTATLVDVPDGGTTLALLGLAIAGLAGLRRKLSV